MPHIPAAIVRLLYGERAEEKTAPKRFLSNAASNSLTSAPPGVEATIRECLEW